MTPADFRTLLLAQPGLAAVVADRVFPVLIPPEVWSSATEKPCVVYQIVGVARSATFCSTNTLQAESVTVDCYARTYDAAYSLSRLVAQIVDFSGLVGDTVFDPIRLETEIDLVDSEPGLYRRSMNFTVWNRSA